MQEFIKALPRPRFNEKLVSHGDDINWRNLDGDITCCISKVSGRFKNNKELSLTRTGNSCTGAVIWQSFVNRPAGACESDEKYKAKYQSQQAIRGPWCIHSARSGGRESPFKFAGHCKRAKGRKVGQRAERKGLRAERRGLSAEG